MKRRPLLHTGRILGYVQPKARRVRGHMVSPAPIPIYQGIHFDRSRYSPEKLRQLRREGKHR